MASPKARKMAGIATAALAATTAGANPADAASPAHAKSGHLAPVTAPLVTWKNNKTGRYLTVHDGGTANGDEITTNSTATQTQQHWYLSGGPYFYDLKNQHSAKCLAVIGPNSNGIDIDQWGCGGSPGGSVDASWAIVSVTKSGHFIGDALYTTLRGPTGIIACENTTTHSVYAGTHFSPAGGGAISAPKSCVWTRG